MIRRTTIEIDDELLSRAKQALGAKTIRGAVEDALRQAAENAEGKQFDRAARQRGYLQRLGSRVDASLLRSEEMWR